MECALLERCPNTLFRRKLSRNLRVKPRMAPDLALPNCGGFRSITTAVASTPKPTPPTPTTPKKVTPATPTYTSLAKIIIPSDSGASEEESVSSSPRTPMRNCLVEKAAHAYLKPLDSFNKSRQLGSLGLLSNSSNATSWTQSLSCFLPHLSMSVNPFNAFNSVFQVFRFYVTGGATAFQQPIVSCTMSRSSSMPMQRMSYIHADLSIQ